MRRFDENQAISGDDDLAPRSDQISRRIVVVEVGRSPDGVDGHVGSMPVLRTLDAGVNAIWREVRAEHGLGALKTGCVIAAVTRPSTEQHGTDRASLAS